MQLPVSPGGRSDPTTTALRRTTAIPQQRQPVAPAPAAPAPTAPAPTAPAPTAPAPTATATTETRRRVPPWWVEVGILTGFYVVYELIRGLQPTTLDDANRTGWALLRWERRWHLAFESPLNSGLQHLPVLAVLSGYYYATLHFVVTPVVLIFLYRKHPHRYGRARTALGLATAAALIGYLLLPTTPPRLLDGGGFTDTMASVSNWGWWGNEASAPRGAGALTNQWAAMPSMHVGWALWCGWCIARYARSRTVRILGVAYPVLTALVVMATANHYFVDGLAGSLLVALALVGVTGFLPMRARRGRPAALFRRRRPTPPA